MVKLAQISQQENASGKANSRVKTIALALIATAAQVVAAPPATYHSHMTGAKLVRDMLADPAGSPLNSVRRERAMGYIEGVMDAAAGTQWCPAGRTVPHELNYAVVEELSAMSSIKLKGDASALVLAILARLYPCAMPPPRIELKPRCHVNASHVRRDGLTDFALPFSSNQN